MSMPGFTAEASLYRTTNHYVASAAGGSAGVGAELVPQDCGLFKEIFCSVAVAACVAACGALCLDGGPAACAGCATIAMGGLFVTCKDCLPGFIQALINIFEGGGGGGGGGGGPPQCCPPGRTCSCGGRCVRQTDGSIRCVGGLCLAPHQACP